MRVQVGRSKSPLLRLAPVELEGQKTVPSIRRVNRADDDDDYNFFLDLRSRINVKQILKYSTNKDTKILSAKKKLMKTKLKNINVPKRHVSV